MTYNVFSGTLNPTHFTSLQNLVMRHDAENILAYYYFAVKKTSAADLW